MKWKSKYALRMIVGFLGYALGLVALNYFDAEHLPHRYWLVLLPLLPLLYMVDTIVRHAAELDEMWRKIITEAAAFSGSADSAPAIS
jgi:ABC-type multidrug transport system permease subunit